MKPSFVVLGVAASFAAAAPNGLIKRQSTTSNDLEDGKCGEAVLIYARGTAEAGNMGTIGPQVCTELQSDLGGADNVACQGVGGPYDADVASNVLPRGTSQAAIDEATRLFTEAYTNCSNSSIVAGGYSQGSAVIAASITDLPADIKAKVVGVALWGYTQDQQNSGGIPGYPQENIWIDCDGGQDPVCNGTLIVDAAHLSYFNDGSAQKGADFLASKVEG